MLGERIINKEQNITTRAIKNIFFIMLFIKSCPKDQENKKIKVEKRERTLTEGKYGWISIENERSRENDITVKCTLQVWEPKLFAKSKVDENDNMLNRVNFVWRLARRSLNSCSQNWLKILTPTTIVNHYAAERVTSVARRFLDERIKIDMITEGESWEIILLQELMSYKKIIRSTYYIKNPINTGMMGGILPAKVFRQIKSKIIVLEYKYKVLDSFLEKYNLGKENVEIIQRAKKYLNRLGGSQYINTNGYCELYILPEASAMETKELLRRAMRIEGILSLKQKEIKVEIRLQLHPSSKERKYYQEVAKMDNRIKIMEKGKHKEKNRYPLRAYIFNGTSAIYEVLDQQNTIYCSALSITKSDRCSLNQFIEMDENLLKEQEGNNEEMWELNVANKIIERMAKTVY